MNIQVLVATMNQCDEKIIQRMNINSDAIIINQCDRFEYKKINYNGNNIDFFSFAERGVGLSRNTALMRATSDICLFADEDMTFVDNYKELVINAFKENPDADMIMFNVPSKNPNRSTYEILKKGRVRWYNSLRFGAVNIAVKTKVLRKKNIYFSLLFGGGADYSAGEDSMFIADSLKKGLKIYANPTVIGYVAQEDSYWFKGYIDKYFIDKGAFYGLLSSRWSRLLSLQFVLRHRNMFKQDKTMLEAYRLMLQGIKEVKTN